MKKTRKLLSVILSVLIAFASMPMVYTATVASDVSAYAVSDEGTIDNPTRPVSETGVFDQFESSTYHLNINQAPLDFVFYQTMDDEYFELSQSIHIEKYCGYSLPTVIIHGYKFDMDDDATSAFFSTYEGQYSWYANDDESAGIKEFPDNEFEISGTPVGCPDYIWNMNGLFKGQSSGSKGEIYTGYKQVMRYTTDGVAYQAVVPTTIHILDARELVKEMAEAEEIIANADNYKAEYISAVQAALNSVPDYLKDFSEVYSQDIIDGYVEQFNNISKNAADYRAYNKTYSSLKSITNERDAFDANSFVAFQEEIFTIDANLPKALEKTEQATVDAATQALKDAYAKLVHKDVGREEESYYWDSLGHAEFGNTDISIDNQSFKFMQIRDNQQFSFTQTWSIARSAKEDGGDTAPIFHGIVLDPTTTSTSSSCNANNCKNKNTVGATNGTTTFLNIVSADSKNPITYSTEENTTIQTHEFTKWEYLGSYNEDNEKSMSGAADIVNASTGKLVANAQNTGNREFKITEKTTFKLKVSPTFIGLSGTESGEKKFDFVQRLGITFKTGAFVGAFGTSHKKHMHHASSIVITDVRTLLSTIASAEKELSNPNRSDAYKVALQTAIDSAPMEMTYGVKYYTQEQVDSIVNNILSVKEDCADYSEFNDLYNELKALKNNDRYTDESFEVFNNAIEEINFNLDKNLDASQQDVVDAATQALKQAYINLEYFAVDGDVTFSDTDIPELASTYNTLSFDISKTEYNFMQTLDSQELAIKTDVHFTNTDSGYKTSLHDLEYSFVIAGQDTCARRQNPDDGCHGLDTITDKHNSAKFIGNIISGIERYADDSEEVTDIGVIAQNNGWVVDEHRSAGTGFVSDGKIVDAYEIGTGDYYASSEIVFKGLSGGFAIDEAAKNLESYHGGYSWRFGWQYRQNVWGSTITNRHVHIPVNVNVTDARALAKFYYQIEDIINNHSDYLYTMETLKNLYYAWKEVPADMAEGSTYYTQDVVNASYASLYDSYAALQSGADYNEYFDASVKVQEIISSENRDEYGNPLYTPEFFEAFVKNVTEIDSNLDKNLPADDAGENQKTIDAATEALLNEISKLENEKRADYTALEEALIRANNLKNAEGVTYTESTLKVLEEAIKAATELDRNLLAKDQATVDAVTSQLTDAINNLEYKADYSEFEEAYKRVEDIVNNPDKYTSATVEAAKNALENADKLDKDLSDIAVNRQTIADATQALKDILASAEEKADYSEFDKAKDALEEIVNNPDKYTDETVKNAQDALEEANKIDPDLPKDENGVNQGIIDDATQNMQDVINGAQEKADYSDYNDAKAEADSLVNDDGNGNPIYNEDAFNEYKEAVENVDKGLSKDLPKDDDGVNQGIIDKATQDLTDLKTELENNKKADYTEFDAAKDALEEIVNNPDKYTDETVKNAQDALEEANKIPSDMVVGENNVNQDMIDDATQNMKDVIDSAEKKADYIEFDKAKDALEEIVNNPDKYTDETVKNAQDALEEANKIDPDLPKDENGVNQGIIDDATQNMQDVINGAQEKADYSEYNDAKSEADSLVNDDGNGNPIYDEDAFNDYKEAVENVDKGLNKDLPKDDEGKNQAIIDDATQRLEDLKAELEEKKIYTVTFIGLNGETFSVVEYVNGSAFSTISAPALPEATDTIVYAGWLNGAEFMVAESVLTGNVTLTIASEFSKIVPKSESTVVVDKVTGYVTGINKDTTVAQLKAELQNEAETITIVDFNGNVLADDALVGTGAVVSVNSKYTTAVYESKTVIIYGDLDGDGDVDADDFAKAKKANVADETFYSEEEKAFFLANDVNGDGAIDVLDSWTIGRIRNGFATVI